ncbi:AI-2E family transporter [Bacillus sp. FJAT-52991]|uniref:AI-2E family transporter n=1 Tax=Bacillus kandeliae TaxID=3129297 RepID=A0ABZ2N6W1_9BACI
MTHKSWFQFGIAIVLLLVVIMLFREVKDIFYPLTIIIETVFLPILLAGVLFYLTRPIVQWLTKKRLPKWSAILVVYILLFGVFWMLITIIGPVVNDQMTKLIKNAPKMFHAAEEGISYIMNQRERLPENVIQAIQDVIDKIQTMAMSFGTWLITFIQSLLQATFSIVLVPFFLFYMLKDREKFVPFITQFFNGNRKIWLQKTLSGLDNVLKSYIQGQLLVSFLIGVMLFIGYVIIKLDYALILALFGMATNVIPFLGPYLAVAPAILVAWTQDPQMVIYVAIIMLVAQQIESNLVSPNVMGKALDVHPLTVITVILTAGNIAGIWGVILGVPAYAVIKTIVSNLYDMRQEIKQAATKDV